jgi:two-component system, cell cycle response regulator DivK
MAHILIIDDYPDTRDVTELILTDAGHSVISVGDGFNGCHMAEYNQPDLILMDLALPILDGWEATRRLKANPTTWHIPVVAFTAHDTPDGLSRAHTAGCVAVIAKPFEMDSFLTMIEAILAPHAPPEQQRAIGMGSLE